MKTEADKQIEMQLMILAIPKIPAENLFSPTDIEGWDVSNFFRLYRGISSGKWYIQLVDKNGVGIKQEAYTTRYKAIKPVPAETVLEELIKYFGDVNGD